MNPLVNPTKASDLGLQPTVQHQNQVFPSDFGLSGLTDLQAESVKRNVRWLCGDYEALKAENTYYKGRVEELITEVKDLRGLVMKLEQLVFAQAGELFAQAGEIRALRARLEQVEARPVQN